MTEFVRKKPFALAVSMAVLGFVGAVGSVAAGGILLMALFGGGPFLVNGEEVTRDEFLRSAVPFTTIYLAGCLLALAVAWSIYQEHARSPPLLLAFSGLPILALPLAGICGLPLGDLLAYSTLWLVVPAVAWIYLYKRDSVVQYYTALWADREPV